MVLGLVWFWVSFGLFSDFCYLVWYSKTKRFHCKNSYRTGARGHTKSDSRIRLELS